MTSPASQDPADSADDARAWNGFAILKNGYRPFFLLGAAWAAFVMVGWIALLAGWSPDMTRFAPVSWHAHEMLFGFLGAVLAGFLLTAVPNWTGRRPIAGWPLAGLLSLWLAGRIVFTLSSGLSPVLVAVLDLMFPVGLACLVGYEILAGKNWRNLPILILLALFILANALFHADVAQGHYAANGPGFRLALAVAVMLITLIGGRIVPNFTRNWLKKRSVDELPAPFGMIDRIALLSTLTALIGWVAMPEIMGTAALCGLAGCANLIRLSRWSGLGARSEPLLWILHVGYLFVPLGFLSIAASFWDQGLSPPIGAQHIWMAGAVGVMPLAMMTRASLGHAGRPLAATRGVTMLYCLVIASVVLRFIAAFDPIPHWVLHVSALSWIGGFAGFCILFWPILAGRPG